MAVETPEKTVSEQVKEELDTIEPRTENKTWTLDDGAGLKREYVQKPLGFFGKVEFFSLLGDTVDEMNEVDKPLAVNEMFGATADMDSLVAVVSRLAAHAPDFLKEAYCIALGIPRGEREWAKYCMENFLTDEEGFDLMERFIDQNGDSMRDFFAEKGQSLLKRVTGKFFPKNASSDPAPSSKRSKRTQPTTA